MARSIYYRVPGGSWVWLRYASPTSENERLMDRLRAGGYEVRVSAGAPKEAVR